MEERTIAAVATARGMAGIGVIRISGSDAIKILKLCFRAKNGTELESVPNFKAVYGNVVDGEEVIDEAIALVMRAPHSYTGEDVTEIQCHGGYTTLSRILALVYRLGAKPAERGEFTKRAFLNGRIDLTKAEAVMDLVAAKTESARKSAVSALSGKLFERVEGIKEKVVGEVARLEAAIDFPDEMEEENVTEIVKINVSDIINDIESLINTYREGKILKDGLKTAIIGRPNVGKSSLLNALMKEERSIVSNIPGTTRDFLEAEVNIKGVPLVLVDTAGIREARDEIEHIGVNLAKKHAGEAELVLAVFDASENLTKEDRDIFPLLDEENTVFILNKTDKANAEGLTEKEILREFSGAEPVKISAKNLTGLDELSERILKFAQFGEDSSRVLVKNERVRDALISAENFLKSAKEAMLNGVSEDFITIDLRAALNALGEITGETLDEKVIDRIFEDFCIGK